MQPAFKFLKDYLPVDQGDHQPKQQTISGINFILPAHSFEAHFGQCSLYKMLTSGLCTGKSSFFASRSTTESCLLAQH